MFKTCCGLTVFLAELSESPRTLHRWDPCGFASTGVGRKTKVLAWQKHHGKEKQKKVVDLSPRSDGQSALCSARLKATTKQSWAAGNEPAQWGQKKAGDRFHHLNCEVMSEWAALLKPDSWRWLGCSEGNCLYWEIMPMLRDHNGIFSISHLNSSCQINVTNHKLVIKTAKGCRDRSINIL